MPEIAVLVSVGRNPASLRPRRAELDARAVELALGCAGAATLAVHGGDAAATDVLGEYLGMGARLVRLDLPDGADPLPALAAWLAVRMPAVVLSGAVSETGEASGMVPFWLAERLGWPIVPRLVGLELRAGHAEAVQALPGGRRRRLDVPLPFFGTVDRSGPEPRLSAYARRRNGRIEVVPSAVAPTDERPGWTTRPARPRPKRRLDPAHAGGGDRLGAILAGQRGGSGAQPAVATEPGEAAAAILAFLEREGLFEPAAPGEPGLTPGPVGDGAIIHQDHAGGRP